MYGNLLKGGHHNSRLLCLLVDPQASPRVDYKFERRNKFDTVDFQHCTVRKPGGGPCDRRVNSSTVRVPSCLQVSRLWKQRLYPNFVYNFFRFFATNCYNICNIMRQPEFWQKVYRMAHRNLTPRLYHPQTPPHYSQGPNPPGPPIPPSRSPTPPGPHHNPLSEFCV